MSARDDLVVEAVSGRRVSRTGWVRGNCPFCEGRAGTPDRKLCLGLEVDTGKWHCFRCSAMGLVQGVDLEDIESASRAPRQKPDEKTVIEFPEGFFELYSEPGLSSWFADGAREYLADRGVGPAVGRSAGIGVTLAGKHRGRIVVPIRDVSGRVLVGWSARLFVESAPLPSGWVPPKYLYPTGMDRQSTLYNAAALHERTDNPVFVVEGVFDALALWPDAVGCLGAPSPGQLDALIASPRPVVALLDGDAWRKGQALALKLRIKGKRVAWVRLPPKTDPGSTDAGTLRAAAAQALKEVA